MSVVVGVLAHVDAGKTTFCEQILFHSHTIRVRGRVITTTLFWINNPLERQGGLQFFLNRLRLWSEERLYLTTHRGILISAQKWNGQFAQWIMPLLF